MGGGAQSFRPAFAVAHLPRERAERAVHTLLRWTAATRRFQPAVHPGMMALCQKQNKACSNGRWSGWKASGHSLERVRCADRIHPGASTVRSSLLLSSKASLSIPLLR